MHRPLFPPGAKALLLVGVGTFVASTASAFTPPTFNAPGILPAGIPDFTNSATNLFFGFGSYVLTATGTGGTFNLNPTQSYSVSNESFTLTADFNSKGQLTGGTESIWGSISGLTSNTYQNLYTASLAAYGVSTSTIGLGFETTGATGWASKFQTGPESVYLYSPSMASFDSALKSGSPPVFYFGSASALTTVPLPAAGWLLGPALAGLLAAGRRRRSSSEVLSAA